jgi:hypothetical protein
MEKKNFQYANLPQYQYHSIQNRHYQTFNRQTLQFSWHPILPKSTVSDTNNDNENNNDKPPDPNDGADHADSMKEPETNTDDGGDHQPSITEDQTAPPEDVEDAASPPDESGDDTPSTETEGE